MIADRLRRHWGVMLAASVALAAILWLAQRVATDRAVEAERVRLQGVAALAESGFRRQVETFELVATTLSADPEVRRILEGGDAAAAARLNDRLARLTARLDASVIYLMNRSGTTVVSSNWRQPDSFLGENYRFRAYFTQAIEHGEASQFALGTRSLIPGLFLGRRIDGARGPIGVIVVKVRFDRLEREWARSVGEAFVSDPDGIILVTSDPELRFRTVVPVPETRRAELRAKQAFGDAPLTLHPAFESGTVLQEGRWDGQDSLAVSLPAAGERRMTVLAPISQTVATARNVGWLAVALLILAGIAGSLAIAWRRRVALARAEAAQQRHVADLKARLEQANRLSSLGQVAAGVGHEVNQPLAAIAMRAASAARLIETGRSDEARAAIAEIDGLVARAGAITGELRQFARRSDRSLGPVRLAAVFAGLELLMGDAVRRAGAALTVRLADPELAVTAEQARLEQVLVNLVQNAIDAGGEGVSIAIEAVAEADRVRISVSDDGHGIPEDIRAQLFQPFTSTKLHGLGLGLVISRDIVTEFGGELTVAPAEGRGTTFLIDLARAP